MGKGGLGMEGEVVWAAPCTGWGHGLLPLEAMVGVVLGGRVRRN